MGQSEGRIHKIRGCHLAFFPKTVAFSQGPGLNSECSWKGDNFWIKSLPETAFHNLVGSTRWHSYWFNTWEPIHWFNTWVPTNYMVCCPHLENSQYSYWQQIDSITFKKSSNHEGCNVPWYHCNDCKDFTILHCKF